jgi:hypothetical protein
VTHAHEKWLIDEAAHVHLEDKLGTLTVFAARNSRGEPTLFIGKHGRPVGGGRYESDHLVTINLTDLDVPAAEIRGLSQFLAKLADNMQPEAVTGDVSASSMERKT